MIKMFTVVIGGVCTVGLFGCTSTSPQPRPTAGSPVPGFQRVATGPSTDSTQKEIMNDELPEILVDEEIDIPQPNAKETQVEDAEEVLEQANGVEDVNDLQGQPEILVPNEVNLDIPFYAQAPDGDWTLPRKEACEEASIILARYYLADEALSKATFKEEVLRIVSLEEQMLGKYIDTTVAETQRIYEQAYPDFGTTKILENPTIEQLKVELAQGHPIVAPFAGKELGNSNFTNGGPRYHMLVIKGYDDEYFYTNDVGTRRGENFPYTYETIMNALHDLVPNGQGDIREGAKRVLVLMND